MSKESKAVLGCLSVPILAVLGNMLSGWVLVALWGWFILPIFPSMPHLTIIQAIGLSIVVGYLTHQVTNNKTSGDKEIGEIMGEMISNTIGYPLIILGFGWAIHLFL